MAEDEVGVVTKVLLISESTVVPAVTAEDGAGPETERCIPTEPGS